MLLSILISCESESCMPCINVCTRVPCAHLIFAGDDVTQRHSDHGECARSGVVILAVSPDVATTCCFEIQIQDQDTTKNDVDSNSNSNEPKPTSPAKAKSRVPLLEGLPQVFGSLLQPIDSSATGSGENKSEAKSNPEAEEQGLKQCTFMLQCLDRFGNACNSGSGNTVEVDVARQVQVPAAATDAASSQQQEQQPSSDIVNLHDGRFFCTLSFASCPDGGEFAIQIRVNGKPCFPNAVPLHVAPTIDHSASRKAEEAAKAAAAKAAAEAAAEEERRRQEAALVAAQEQERRRQQELREEAARLQRQVGR